MNVSEAFNLSKVDKKLSALFDDVELKSVKVYKDKRVAYVYIEAGKIIPFKDKNRLENVLYSQVFKTLCDNVVLNEQFKLPGVGSLSRYMGLYKESMLDELQYENRMDYMIVKSASITINDSDNSIHIKAKHSFISDLRQDALKEWIVNHLKERFNIDATVSIEYSDDTNVVSKVLPEDYIPPYEVYDIATMKSRTVSPLGYSFGLDNEGQTDDSEKDFIFVDDNTELFTDAEGDNLQAEDAANDGKTGDNRKRNNRSEKKDSEKKDSDKKNTDNKSREKKSFDSTSGKKSYDKKSFDKKSFDRKSSYKDYKQKAPADSDVFYGRDCEGELLKISDINEGMGEVVVRGCIDECEYKEFRNGNGMFILNLTDFTDTIHVKVFVRPAIYEDIKDKMKKGNFIRVKGNAEFDSFENDIAISRVNGIKPEPAFSDRVKRVDTCEHKRIELHCHTQMSDMDGVTPPKDLLKRAVDWGHRALAITDHGLVQGFPIAMHALEDIQKGNEAAKDFKIIYGVEGYIVDDEVPLVKNERGQTLKDSFVVFDLETTGLNPYRHKIIEIGAVKIVNGIITERFSKFINPLVPVPYEIEELTGISDSMLAKAGLVEDVLPEFLEFCEGSVVVAHNAVFDVNFIRLKANELGLTVDFTVADTMTMARFLLPELKTFNLKSVTKATGVILENHHRAVDDAEATAGILLKFFDMLKEKSITTLKQLNEWGVMDAEVVKKTPSHHIIILAATEPGRVNLYRLISESHITYYHKQPRIPKSLLRKYRDGLIVGSACEAGELYQAIIRGEDENEIKRIVDFYDYLEVQPAGNNEFMVREKKYGYNSLDDIREDYRKIVFLGECYNKPVVATSDVHFLDPEDAIYRSIIMAGKGFEDADFQPPLYLHTTDEMLEEFSYLGEEKAYEVVVTNSNKIADSIDYISPVRPDKCPPVIENSDEDLRNICYEKAHSMYGDPLPEIVQTRLDRELNSIISNGYSVMYIIAKDLVWKSNEDGYLVGSRGSVGSSFAATMSGITEVNPLPAHYYCKKCKYSDFESDICKEYFDRSGFDMPDKICPNCGEKLTKDGHNIPFETFLGFKGDKEPDIDLNFSGEYQSNAHKYTEVLFGEGHTFRAGTIGTLAEKTAYGYVMNYYKERGITKRRCEMERIAKGCTGVHRTTGQHPGGIVVLPHGEEIYSFTPIQKPANDMSVDIITTHFEYHAIDHNLLKLDILGHDDPTMIRMLQDITGVEIDDIPLCDEKVMSLFYTTEALGIRPEDIGGCTLGSLGIPELGTKFSMDMLIDTSPSTFSELVRISGLSHGTDVWTNNAQDLIRNGDCTLSTAICTRDDIMTYLINMGVENSHAFKIMESVRKGRGLTPEMEAEMIENNVPDWYIGSCKKIKYMFPKAHAVAYIMMGIRIAWFKVYKPLAYYAAYFSIRAKSFDYEMMALGLDNLMKNYRAIENSENVKAKDKELIKDMKIVQEFYARGFKFEAIDLYKVKVDKFTIVEGKLMPSLSTIEGLGGIAAESLVREAAKGEFFSIDDFKERTGIGVKTIEKMKALGLFGDLPQSNQLSIMDFLK